MKIIFEKPLVPNYVRTDKGNFALADLSEEELDEYTVLFHDALKARRLQQIEMGRSE